MSQRSWRIDLLPRELLIKTGPVDEGDWYYRPLLRSVMRRRIALLDQLLQGQRFRRLLDLGYGSGVLMPHLCRYCDELHGIDIHPYDQEVRQRLSSAGVQVGLVRGTVESMPYESGSFDAVVAMSSLEFIDDIESALGDIARVLRPGGVLMAVSPQKTTWGDQMLRWAAGSGKVAVFGDRREHVRAAIPGFFDIELELTYSPLPGVLPPVYRAFRGHPKSASMRRQVAPG
jgi:SAM-dependent methyltransferase